MIEDYAERARSLVGVPFRAQGRNDVAGLDCVGLAIAVYGLERAGFRADYRLRGNHLAELRRSIQGPFRRVSRKSTRVGDLLLFAIGGQQFHLGIRTGHGIVHADAGLRRIVERPGAPPWPLIGAFRRRSRKRKAS